MQHLYALCAVLRNELQHKPLAQRLEVQPRRRTMAVREAAIARCHRPQHLPHRRNNFMRDVDLVASAPRMAPAFVCVCVYV